MLCTQTAARLCSVQASTRLPRRSARVVTARKVVAAARTTESRGTGASNVKGKQEKVSASAELTAVGAALLPLLLAAGPASASVQEIASVAELAGVVPVQNVLAGLCIFFIIAQGPKGEGMVNSMNESRMFNFSETRNFVTVATWGLVVAFLVLSALAALR